MARDTAIGFSELHTQMKITNKLLAAQLREQMQQKDLVRLLMTTGASDQELADVLGTTAATVSATKQRLKKEALNRAKAAEVVGELA
jgi:DNA-binding CsgD family transcriptional regulator